MGEVSADFWERFGARVRGYVRRRIVGDADVDDVVQDVFSKAHAGRLEDPARAEAWIFGIARRAVVDHVRRRRPAAPLPDLAAPVEPVTVTREISGCLSPMMESLPPEDREALRLTDLEGLTQKDLAVRLGISLPGAKSRVQRARRRLKESLLACCDVEMDRRGNALSYQARRPCAC